MISAEMEHTGTITYRRFDGHPECLVFPFEYQTGTKYSRNVMIPYIHPVRYAWPEFPQGTTFERAYELVWNEELKTFLRNRKGSKFRDVNLVMSEEKMRALFLRYCYEKGRYVSFRAVVVESLLRAALDSWENLNRPTNPRFHVAYNPGMVADTDKIMVDFPSCHIIHIVRNPHSAYRDYLKRPYPQQTLEEYCLAHTVAHHLAYNYAAKYPNNFHLLRAEDLMEDTEKTLTPVLTKIGMAWDDVLLYPSFNGKDISGYLPPFGTVEKPTAEYNRAMAASLPRETKDAISKECVLLMKTFGYEEYGK
jgi:hypothetical protein